MHEGVRFSAVYNGDNCKRSDASVGGGGNRRSKEWYICEMLCNLKIIYSNVNLE